MPPIPAEPTEKYIYFILKYYYYLLVLQHHYFSDINFINDTLNELERI